MAVLRAHGTEVKRLRRHINVTLGLEPVGVETRIISVRSDGYALRRTDLRYHSGHVVTGTWKTLGTVTTLKRGGSIESYIDGLRSLGYEEV